MQLLYSRLVEALRPGLLHSRASKAIESIVETSKSSYSRTEAYETSEAR